MVKPNVIVLAHTATSYTLGRGAEAELLQRLQAQYAIPFATAFGSVAAALGELGVKRVALGTPYSEEITLKGKAHLEEHGFEVVSHGRLENVTDIYEETAERAYRLGRAVDTPNAQAVFLSGTGMPTIKILEALEQDLGKPAISANSAMMWHALRLAGVRHRVSGYGRLLAICTQPIARRAHHGSQDREACRKKRLRPARLHPDDQSHGRRNHPVHLRPGRLRRQGSARTPR